MQIKIAIFVIIASSMLLLPDAGAVTNNASGIKEVISITDIVKPHVVNDSKEVSLKLCRYFMEPVRWSPDGGRILVLTRTVWSQYEEMSGIYVMNADGTGLKKIVSSRFINSKGARITSPTWIQGGDKIAFFLNRPNASLFVVINPDGTELRAIGTNLTDMESILAFLPDAGHWQGFYAGDLNEFTTVTADGMNLENILKEDGKTNATKIASVERPKYSLYTMDPDGTGKTLLALTSWGEFLERPVFAWNPSGDKIVFSAIVDPATGKQVDFDTFWARKEYYEAHIFLSNPDGTERIQLTAEEPYNVITGGWSPDGSRLIVGSSSDIEMKAWNVSIIKLSGHDEVISVYAPLFIKQGEDFVIEVKSMSKPLEKALITLNGKEIGATNEKGVLKYSLKEPDRYLLNVTKEGYKTATKTIFIKENEKVPEQKETEIKGTIQPAKIASTPEAPGFTIILSILGLMVSLFYHVKKKEKSSMKRNINNVFVIAQKEFADSLWSPRFWILISLFLLILFSYSYRTGLGSSFTDVIQIIAVFAPVIGIALGFDAVTKETESNSLNVLLTHPVFRDNIITGKILGLISTLGLVVFLSVSVLFGTNLLISGKQASLLELNRFLIFAILTFIYLLIFLALGLLTSVISKNEVDSLTYGIAIWLNLIVVFGATVMIIVSIATGQSLFDMGNNQQFKDFNFQLQKLSPIHHYAEVAAGFSDLSWGSLVKQETIMGVLDPHYTLEQWINEFWPNIVVLAAIPLILLAFSFIAFLRKDI